MCNFSGNCIFKDFEKGKIKSVINKFLQGGFLMGYSMKNLHPNDTKINFSWFTFFELYLNLATRLYNLLSLFLGSV